MCDMGFPCLVESYRPLGLGNRMTGPLIPGPWGLFEHQGGSIWGGNRARLHLCILHRGTSSLTSPVNPTWPPPPHIAIASRDCKHRVLNSTEHEEHTVSPMLKLPPPAAVAEFHPGQINEMPLCSQRDSFKLVKPLFPVLGVQRISGQKIFLNKDHYYFNIMKNI